MKTCLKAVEGHVAEIAFGLARDDNAHIDVRTCKMGTPPLLTHYVYNYYPDKTKTHDVMLLWWKYCSCSLLIKGTNKHKLNFQLLTQ